MQFQPVSCVWELTLKCNLKCSHCGSSAGSKRVNQLSTELCLKIADSLVNLKCRSVTLIGGEIYYYKDWEKIARKLSDGGVHVNFVSNGYFISTEEIVNIKFAGISNVAISIDGTAEIHNRIRNKKNAFARLINTISQLKEACIPVSVITTLTKEGVSDLENIYEFLVNRGITDWQIQLVHPMGFAEPHKNDIIVSKADVSYITDFIRKKRFEQKVRIYAGDNIGYYDRNEMYLRNTPGTFCEWEGCQAGISVLGIDNEGNVRGCQSIYSSKFIEGNLRNESLESIWNNPDNFSYNRKFKPTDLSGNCKDCEKGPKCKGGCRASNYFLNNDLFNNYYCSYQVKDLTLAQ